MSVRTRICPICEAACSLEVRTEGRRIVSCRGNAADNFSTGHLCPKGVALAELDADPARLRTPLVLRDGKHVPCSWEDAYAEIGRRLGNVRANHGPGAVALYIGNPTAHNVGMSMSIGPIATALQTPHIYSAASVDQLPKQLACELLYGNDMAIAVPDIERCDFLLMLGANPLVSNGSLWMVPDFRGKAMALRQRGGQFVVVDPRRTETARIADTHIAIRPGTDAWLLIALLNQLAALGVTPPPPLAERLRGYQDLLDCIGQCSLEEAVQRTGVAAVHIDALARGLAGAERPAIYGRIGTTLQRFGTLTSFLIDVLNIQLGALDREGGAMFPEQPWYAAQPAGPHAPKFGRWRTRVSGYPEVLGQFPVAALAEEMETPGPGQLRGLVVLAGNPIVSTPDSARLERAIAGLECVIAVDIYPSETARYAHVILPGTSPFEDSHYDHFLGAMSYRNTARYSPPLFPRADRPDEWRMGLGVAFAVTHGRAATSAELDGYEDDVVAGTVQHHCVDPHSKLFGRDVQSVLAGIGPQRGVERLLDVGIRAGSWGDGFVAGADGLTLQHLCDAPNSIDLGAPKPRLGRLLRTADGAIDLLPSLIRGELQRLRDERAVAGLLLVGRRNIQTNNSWLHTLPTLGKGPARCVLEMHPDDAAVRGIGEGDRVRLHSVVGQVSVPVRLTEDIAPGVVALPHGFSNENAGDVFAPPNKRRGVNANLLAPGQFIDVPSGTSALNGIAVECEKVG